MRSSIGNLEISIIVGEGRRSFTRSSNQNRRAAK